MAAGLLEGDTALAERFGAYVTGASIVVDGGIALHNWIDPKE